MSNSAKFWTGLGLLTQLILLIFCWEAEATVNGILGFVTLLFIFEDNDPPVIVWFNYPVAIVMIIAGIIMSIVWLYKNSIGRFNKWLDSIDFSKLF